ncbi:MAG TPA: methyltransferase, partial [Kofleriaceae bacterium]|nr:methyltransferase [Kofleriaceae bacterium]
MDVFGAALGDAGKFLRDAAVAAARELGVFEALAASPRTVDDLAAALKLERGARRLRALVELLAGLGHLRRIADDRFESLGQPELHVRFALVGDAPPRPDVPKVGWGLIADVIRTDKPLDVPGGEYERRMHAHLASAGAAAARELFEKLRAEIERSAALGSAEPTAARVIQVGPELSGGENQVGPELSGDADSSNAAVVARENQVGPELSGVAVEASEASEARGPTLLDLGGGAGGYTAAFLDAFPEGRATLVDYAEVIALAREHLARFGDRVRFIVSDARTIEIFGTRARV